MSDSQDPDMEEVALQDANSSSNADDDVDDCSPRKDSESPTVPLSPSAAAPLSPVAELSPLAAAAALPETMDCPILTQPGLGTTTTTVTTITQTGGDWSTGLFNVCGDTTTCLLGAFVPCCLEFSLAHQYGECLCLPLLPGSILAMRVGIRERFKIRGSVCEDWLAVCMCYPLAVCQMIRETKRRLKTQIYQVSTALECS